MPCLDLNPLAIALALRSLRHRVGVLLLVLLV